MEIICLLVCILLHVFTIIGNTKADPFQPIRNPAYWGEWSDWSECSRTCGHGVMSKTRECFEWHVKKSQIVEPWNCVGRAERQELCYTTVCDSRNNAQETDECWSLNALGRRYFQYWTQVEDGNSCRVMCLEKRSRIRRLVRLVTDGHFCTTNLGQSGKCERGRCQYQDNEVPTCRGPDGKASILDMCLICGGDNSSCILLKGVLGQDEENTINEVKIPRGSTFIKIETLGTTRNTLVLIDSYGRHVINGPGWVSKSGDYKAEGTRWTYLRGPPLESLNAIGPTIGDVIIKHTSKFPGQTTQLNLWGTTDLHPQLEQTWRLAMKSRPLKSMNRKPLSSNDRWRKFISRLENKQHPVKKTKLPVRKRDDQQEMKEEESIFPGERGHQQELTEEESVVLSVSTKRSPIPVPSYLPSSTQKSPYVVTQPTVEIGARVNRMHTNIETPDEDVDVVAVSQGKALVPSTNPTHASIKVSSMAYAEKYPRVKDIENQRKKKISLENSVKKKAPTGLARKRPKEHKKSHGAKIQRKPKKASKPVKKTKKKKKSKKSKFRQRPRDSPFTLRPSVSKVYVNRKKTIKNETRYDVTILSSYRNRVQLMSREYIWVESRCRCPNMKSKRTYILMGNMKDRTDRETRLVLTKKSFVRGFSLGSDRRMRELARTRCKS